MLTSHICMIEETPSNIWTTMFTFFHKVRGHPSRKYYIHVITMQSFLIWSKRRFKIFIYMRTSTEVGQQAGKIKSAYKN